MSGRVFAAIACALLLCGLAAPALAQSPALGQSGSQSKDERARALIGMARVKRDAGDAAGARQYFEQAGAIRTLEPQEREEYFWVLARLDGKTAIATGRAILAETANRGGVRDWMIGQLLADHDEAGILALAQEGERVDPGVAVWPRRIGQSAVRTGNAELALAAFERAMKKTGTTSEDEHGRQQALELRDRLAAPTPPPAPVVDPLASIEHLIQIGDARAAKTLSAFIDSNGCSERTLTLADRLRDPDGTALLVRLLNSSSCPVSTRWLERGIERSEALSQHASARALLARLPAASANKPAMRRLSGQLALWTGHPAEAIPTLEAVVRETPGDRTARTSLIDAYRAVGRSGDAWAAAEPLAQQPGGADMALMYADLALEAGKTDAAYRLLSSIDPVRLNPVSALALIDCAISTSGPDRAVAVARTIPAGTPAFRDVVARQYVLEALVGDVTRAASKRATLASWDPRVTADADGEILGRIEQMHSAAPTTESRARIEGIAAFLSGHAEAALMLARTRASAGDPRGAIAALGETPVPPKDRSWQAEHHAAVSRDELAHGHRDAARAEGQRAVAIDPSRNDVWNSLAEIAAADGPEALASLTDRGAPAEAIVTFHLSRARAAAADKQWEAALGSIDAVLRSDAGNTAAHRLHADVLAWSGRHAEALAAYDAYLATTPDDLDAWRYQARVAGWAGRYAEARARYGRALSRFPQSAVLKDEAAAKTAFFDGRWRAAVDAYDRWLTLEPNEHEALFERAESLRAAGRIADADAALRQLAAAHDQLGAQAWDRVQSLRHPAAVATADARSSDGYNGRKMLDVQTAGGAFRSSFAAGFSTLAVDVSSVRLAGGDAARLGYRAGGRFETNLKPTVALRGQASVWSLDNDMGAAPEYQARIDWRAADRWTVSAITDRALMLENIDVVDRQLAATGASTELRFESPAAGLAVMGGWYELSDGNSRAQMTINYGRRISDRAPGLRLLVWSQLQNFAQSATSYYSPAHQLRVDAGAQYSHDFRSPGFREDVHKTLTAGYLLGTDSQGVLYQHPTVNLTFDFANGLALVARGDWIQSSVYRERSFAVQFKVTR
jgi:tetratricopeptide (TPR) repeat protein